MTLTGGYIGTIQAIKNCIGQTVSDIGRIQTYINNKESADGFGDLEITFADSSYLTLKGLGDAESIPATNKRGEIYQTFNASDSHILSWKRLDLKDDQDWKKIIGQTLRTAAVEWFSYLDGNDRLVACILHFDLDFVTFDETGSDECKFYVNRPLLSDGKQIRVELIE